MSPAPDFLLAFAGPPLAACPMGVGGISCTAGAKARPALSLEALAV